MQQKLVDLPVMKRCKKCGVEKPCNGNYFGKAKTGKNGIRARCKICETERLLLYYSKIKKEIIHHYSHGEMCCACCGFDHYDVLVIDHIRGGKEKYGKNLNVRGTLLAVKLKNLGFPKEFQILCATCNSDKGIKPKCEIDHSVFIHKKRLNTINSTTSMDANEEILNKLKHLETENKCLKELVNDLCTRLDSSFHYLYNKTDDLQKGVDRIGQTLHGNKTDEIYMSDIPWSKLFPNNKRS